MRRFALCAVLFASQALAITVRDDYVGTANEARYVNLANQARFASSGFLQIYDPATNTVASCSGTLVSPNSVLTAGHCFDNWTPTSQAAFALGPDPLKPGGATEQFNVLAWQRHGNYSPANQTRGYALNDLAIVQVAIAGNYQQQTATTPAILNNGPEDTVSGQLQIVGYGTYWGASPGGIPGSSQSPQLGGPGTKRAALNLITTFASSSNPYAQTASNKYTILPDIFGDLIAYNMDAGASRASQGLPANYLEGKAARGDSGGGVFQTSSTGATILVGVTSFGGEDGFYDVTLAGGQQDIGNYAVRVSVFEPWIVQHLYGPSTSAAPGSSSQNPILPFVIAGAQKLFRFSVNPQFAMWLDPASSETVDVSITSGPLATGFSLPSGLGDDIYRLELFDAIVGSFVDAGVSLVGGQHFAFGSTIDRFRVTGIEPSANPFALAMDFGSAGIVDLTWTSITVPEPSAALLLGLAAWALLLRSRDRNRSATTA